MALQSKLRKNAMYACNSVPQKCLILKTSHSWFQSMMVQQIEAKPAVSGYSYQVGKPHPQIACRTSRLDCQFVISVMIIVNLKANLIDTVNKLLATIPFMFVFFVCVCFNLFLIFLSSCHCKQTISVIDNFISNYYAHKARKK